MMHDHEKSDFAIVAGKPTNKAGATAAEPVEPRAGTERNADEQSTHRTLSRDRVTQAQTWAIKGRQNVSAAAAAFAETDMATRFDRRHNIGNPRFRPVPMPCTPR
jgi:hypothetical protein